MFALQFQVSPRGRDARWVVRLGGSFYGAYLDKEQALLDAVDAVRRNFSHPRHHALGFPRTGPMPCRNPGKPAPSVRECARGRAPGQRRARAYRRGPP
jgi:hypothetical protein